MYARNRDKQTISRYKTICFKQIYNPQLCITELCITELCITELSVKTIKIMENRRMRCSLMRESHENWTVQFEQHYRSCAMHTASSFNSDCNERPESGPQIASRFVYKVNNAN